MALEGVVFPLDPLVSYGGNELHNLLGVSWNYDFNLDSKEDEQLSSFDFLGNQTENNYNNCPYGDYYWNSSTSSPPSMVPHFNELQLSNPSSSETDPTNAGEFRQFDNSTTTINIRPKRRRQRSRKNTEEIENQRMTHIAVERNRRKQMNEYLSMLRSLMPDSYVQRGDQASIIGGAINFVKELEQRLQFLGAREQMKRADLEDGVNNNNNNNNNYVPFSEFFTFPQYSTCESSVSMADKGSEKRSCIADIEVSMVESHANLKIRSKRQSNQLLKLITGLHTLRLTIFHLNVTKVDEFVLYCLILKVEEDCELDTADKIATSVNQILTRIQEEAMLLMMN